MELLSAMAHIAGSIFVLFLIGLGAGAVSVWERDRLRRSISQGMAIKLGVAVTDLDRPEHNATVVPLLSERYSSELLRNRLSDVCGYIRTGWGWLSILLQVGVLIGVVWYTITDDLQTAAGAWFLVGIALFFWISSVLFSLVCKVVTGRYPGEASQGRKALLDFVSKKQQS